MPKEKIDGRKTSINLFPLTLIIIFIILFPFLKGKEKMLEVKMGIFQKFKG